MAAAPTTPKRNLFADFSRVLSDVQAEPMSTPPSKALFAQEFHKCLLQLQRSPLACPTTRSLAADVLSPAPCRLFVSPLKSPPCRVRKRSASIASFPAPTLRRPRRDLPLEASPPLLASQVECPPKLICDAQPLPLPAPRSLESILVHHGPIPLEALHRYAEQLLRALDCLHREGRAHGAVTPETVMLLDDGTVELIPFASSTSTLQRNAYSAPEFPEGSGPAADLWSFGLLLLKCASGFNPFEHVSPRWDQTASPAEHQRHCATLLATSLRLVPDTGPALRWLVRTVSCCSRYEPSSRWQAHQLLCSPDCFSHG